MAILEYFVGEKNIFLFCIHQGGTEVYQLAKDDSIIQSFEQLQSIISQAPKGNTYASQLESFNREAPLLFKKILEPCYSQLPKSIERLLLIPDDFLNYLPFEVLTTQSAKTSTSDYSPDSQHYLFEEYQISYHFSASLLLQNWDKVYPAEKSFAGFAPIFPDMEIASQRGCEDGQLYRLQCNQQEVETLGATLSGDIFTGENANRQELLNTSGQYQILHLATHACLDQKESQFNRIYFTDDYLSNFELANSELQTNLVVLSACNTNSGALVKGDGVMSLAKGFALAGCPSMISSLWAVDDCSTSQFMIDLYKHLDAGKTKDQAIQAAKIDHLAKANTESAHPYYWAPFLQYGNLQAMDLQGGGFSGLWWLILGIGGLVVLMGIRSFLRRS